MPEISESDRRLTIESGTPPRRYRQWPYTEAHVSVQRWKVDLPAGTIKGISEEDARELAADCNGTAYHSTVLLITDGPDEGTEVLGPWREVMPDVEENPDEQ